jgi:bacterioferritin (cytochrome b1)
VANDPGDINLPVPSPADTTVIHGITVRKGPAREACFNVVEDNADLSFLADAESEFDGRDMSDAMRRNRLHTHMHNELQSIEIAAQSLHDFPDAPWELQMEIARQCWDESRHARVLYKRLQALGGHKGEFSVMHYEWNITCMQDSLAARLAIQNRTFEAGEMDILKHHVQMWRDAGDPETSEILDAILSDEVHHVRFANRWLKRLAQDDPSVLLKVITGLSFLKKVTAAYTPEQETVNVAGAKITDTIHRSPTNVDDRRLAEFSEKEIAEVLRQEGFAAIVP